MSLSSCTTKSSRTDADECTFCTACHEALGQALSFAQVIFLALVLAPVATWAAIAYVIRSGIGRVFKFRIITITIILIKTETKTEKVIPASI